MSEKKKGDFFIKLEATYIDERGFKCPYTVYFEKDVNLYEFL